MSDTPTPIPVPTEAGNADRTGRLYCSEHGVDDTSYVGRVHAAIGSAQQGIAKAVSDHASRVGAKAPGQPKP